MLMRPLVFWWRFNHRIRKKRQATKVLIEYLTARSKVAAFATHAKKYVLAVRKVQQAWKEAWRILKMQLDICSMWWVYADEKRGLSHTAAVHTEQRERAERRIILRNDLRERKAAHKVKLIQWKKERKEYALRQARSLRTDNDTPSRPAHDLDFNKSVEQHNMTFDDGQQPGAGASDEDWTQWLQKGGQGSGYKSSKGAFKRAWYYCGVPRHCLNECRKTDIDMARRGGGYYLAGNFPTKGAANTYPGKGKGGEASPSWGSHPQAKGKGKSAWQPEK